MLFRKKEEGSMVVEASLIMPIFLSFLIFLISMVQIASVKIALNNAVSDATKQIATHFYPVDLMYTRFSQTDIGTKTDEVVNRIGETRNKMIEVEELIKRYDDFFPKEVNDLISIREKFEGEVIDVYDKTLSTFFQPIVDYYVDDNIIKLENLHVNKVILPNLKNRNQAYFGIEVTYDMPLIVPFINRTLTFKHQAFERVWVGDSIKTIIPPSNNTSKNNGTTGDETQNNNTSTNNNQTNNSAEQENNEQVATLVIDSITSPVQRGRSVRIIAHGPANKTAIIQLYYQSGFEKEKTSRFNGDGILSYSIRIGGNSNEGVYKAVVKVGNLEESASFEVLSKANIDKYSSDRKSNVEQRKNNN